MELKLIARKWIGAFNEHNLEALLALYHDEAEHFSPKLLMRQPESGGYIKGKENLRKWFGDSLERLPDLHYELVRLTADDEQVFMEYIRKVSGEKDLRVGEVLEVKESKIVSSRVYHS